MKIRKKLEVDGNVYKLVSDDIRLEINCTGRAVFQLQASEAVSGLVQFYVGYSSQNKDRLFFTGYVESCHKVDNSQQRVFCRELPGVMDKCWPVSLRHPTLKNVLDRYSELTGLVFIVPSRDYSSTRVPYFQTLGDGFHGMYILGKVFQVTDYVWIPQADGQVFAGSWRDSRWATRPLTVADKWFHRILTDGSRVCPILPALRPGAVLNGKRVQQIRLKGHEMVVTCVK